MIQYAPSTLHYERLKTREIRIGGLTIGGDAPIRVQSMTNTDTENVSATVDQILELEQAGCEIVRVTAPSIRAADCLEDIVNRLRQQGCHVPLVADIHFTPNAAMRAADFVEKIRVNPGNYVDKKKFAVIEYTDERYQAELNRIEDKFAPLVEKCLKLGRAMRIGTNHGSLSDRIMNRYGDTPLGMVESAWEFAEICRRMNFHQFCFSMKASNPQVMVQAYRMLVSRMIDEDAVYPLHLGVTEAGDGEDGRIKSFIGIGTLLDDGIGDTIRVSLTEHPVKEIPVARQLADAYTQRRNPSGDPGQRMESARNPVEYYRRSTIASGAIGGDQVPVVMIESDEPNARHTDSDCPADFQVRSNSTDADMNSFIRSPVRAIPVAGFVLSESTQAGDQAEQCITEIEFNGNWDAFDGAIDRFMAAPTSMVTLSGAPTVSAYRWLSERIDDQAILLKLQDSIQSVDELTLDAAVMMGSLLIDGIGDGIWMNAAIPASDQLRIAYNILQATRLRISRTDYISCPSCGRTLFDLEETTAKIKSATSHLKGLKIAVMGCIVNGPGEMADADFGYVGSGPGKINLYVGHEVVEKNITSETAVDALVELIKSHGKWVEPA